MVRRDLDSVEQGVWKLRPGKLWEALLSGRAGTLLRTRGEAADAAAAAAAVRRAAVHRVFLCGHLLLFLQHRLVRGGASVAAVHVLVSLGGGAFGGGALQKEERRSLAQ